MIIAIWGKSGTGKSVIANELGRFYAQRGKVTVVVDTDMTQPTLPPRLPGTPDNKKTSLGTIFALPQVRDAHMFFHQQTKETGLFFSGLIKDDNYLSYEIGMKQYKQASFFVTACQDVTDVIILDCSGQRGDPFLAVALDLADHFVLVHAPDTKNACWYLAVKSLLSKKRSENNGLIYHIANTVQKHHAVAEYEKTTGVQFTAMLPFSRSLNEMDGQGHFASLSCDRQGRVWQRHFKSDFARILESDSHG